MDEALEEGIEHLTWRNHSIGSFIKKATSHIADAAALLALLHANAARAAGLIAGWSTAALHAPRRKTAQAEDYVGWYRAAVDAKFAAMRDDARAIHALVSEMHLALQV